MYSVLAVVCDVLVCHIGMLLVCVFTTSLCLTSAILDNHVSLAPLYS